MPGERVGEFIQIPGHVWCPTTFFSIGGTPHHIRIRSMLCVGIRGPQFAAQTVCHGFDRSDGRRCSLSREALGKIVMSNRSTADYVTNF